VSLGLAQLGPMTARSMTIGAPRVMVRVAVAGGPVPPVVVSV